jgi:hypothetical protein
MRTILTLFNAVSYAATTGVTTGNVGVRAQVSGAGCSFQIAGAINWTFSNSSHVFNFPGTGTAVAQSVSGCFGQVSTGSSARLSPLTRPDL